MKKTILAGAFALLPVPAFAGVVPGPEIGSGTVGIVVLAVFGVGYVIFRRVRAGRAR